MRNLHWTIRNKLRAKRGASITIALLLFLVCSVIGAVVLTAGTASAGRLSGLEQTDRRYYSVASAAELVAAKLNGRSVICEKSLGNDGSAPVYTVDGLPVIDTDNESLLTALAVHYAGDTGGTEVMELVFPEVTVGDKTYPATTVGVVFNLDADGTLNVELSDEGGFKLTLIMLPAIVRLGEWEETDEFGVTTTTEVNKISWSVSDIK